VRIQYKYLLRRWLRFTGWFGSRFGCRLPLGGGCLGRFRGGRLGLWLGGSGLRFGFAGHSLPLSLDHLYKSKEAQKTYLLSRGFLRTARLLSCWLLRRSGFGLACRL
jgi:hypothetical protein